MHQPDTAPPKRKKKRSLFLPLFFIGFFAFVLLAMIGVAFFLFRFRAATPISVSRESVLRIEIDEQIREYHPAVGLELLFQERRLYLHDYVNLVQKAARDKKIKGIHLVITPQVLGWAQLQELHDCLTEFKSSGKWIWAYGEMWTEKEYFLATAADRLFLPPESLLLLDGLMSRTSFYAPALREIGVTVDVAAFGAYKNFGDPYRYGDMTPEHEEATRALLTAMESELFSAIASARRLDKPSIEAAFADGVYQAEDAVSLGLFDEIAYDDEIADEMKAKLGVVGRVSVVKDKDYYAPQRKPGSWSRPNQIALLFASGSIQSGDGDRGLFGDPVVGSEAFIKQLKNARNDPHTKAIVIRIDSPGGSALASDVIWREIRNTSESGIPVIASMGNVAASGGYYMAMGCDAIVAQPTTITGSIGVVSMRLDASALYDKIKVHVEVLKTAPSADFFDPHRSLTEQEFDDFQARTERFYQRFVRKAAESRDQEYDTLESNARGRVWAGRDALDRNLIDDLGGLETALARAASAAGIDDYSVRVFPQQKDFWTYLRESRNAQKEHTLQSALRFLIPRSLRAVVDCLVSQPYGTATLALIPFWVDIH